MQYMQLSRLELVVFAWGGLSAMNERTVGLYKFETYTEWFGIGLFYWMRSFL
jgi:hypothetical protein